MVKLLFLFYPSYLWGMGLFLAEKPLEVKKVLISYVKDGPNNIMTFQPQIMTEAKKLTWILPIPSKITTQYIRKIKSSDLFSLWRFSYPHVKIFDLPNHCQGEKDWQLRQEVGLAKKLTGIDYQLKKKVVSDDMASSFIDEVKKRYPGIHQENLKAFESFRKLDHYFVVLDFSWKKTSKEVLNLNPFQVAFKSKAFQLPLRFFNRNQKNKMNLNLLTITRYGKVESLNYRTQRLNFSQEIPYENWKNYIDLERKRGGEKSQGVVYYDFLASVYDCQSCLKPYFSKKTLRQLGIYWVDHIRQDEIHLNYIASQRAMKKRPSPRPETIYVSHLWFPYTSSGFPTDLKLQITNQKDELVSAFKTLKKPSFKCSKQKDLEKSYWDNQKKLRP